ncbi:hypothetical protein PISMIDRAFT_13179 [Pisolithus microcarpus 441]|uniref:Uncharacterized protein n=1 Tax=Pisolithus microcarpus 441 TaxID=765257 RepID=A0A0C9ZCQ4_9AGAM|nr:hypothetical protein PISMIDRAFT_13179 [Pisolithus microcarpus 441]
MSFHVHGALHHLIGALIPEAEGEPSYAQLYIYDPQEATERCTCHNPQLDPAIMLSLHTILMDNHPYAPLYKQAHDIMREKPPGEHTDMRVCLTLQQGTDGQRYNLPTVEEIAAVMPGDGSEEQPTSPCLSLPALCSSVSSWGGGLASQHSSA